MARKPYIVKRRERVNRDELPLHSHRRFRCPMCDGVEFKMRSTKDRDGVSTQWRTCLNDDCGYRFVLIVE